MRGYTTPRRSLRVFFVLSPGDQPVQLAEQPVEQLAQHHAAILSACICAVSSACVSPSGVRPVLANQSLSAIGKDWSTAQKRVGMVTKLTS
jgi:hypothetical protein